jgi:hypothetical protein
MRDLWLRGEVSYKDWGIQFIEIVLESHMVEMA